MAKSDYRSYRVTFVERIEVLGWRTRHTVLDEVREIYRRLEAGTLEQTSRTLTRAWYQKLSHRQASAGGMEHGRGVFALDRIKAG